MNTDTHTIAFFYHTSENAQKLKMPKGGYSLTIKNLSANSLTTQMKGYPTLEKAMAAVPAGSTPDRWSIDHPDNAKFIYHYN